MKCSRGCEIDVYESDGAEFLDSSIREARRTHICCECRAEILPGQKYEDCSGKWDGDFNTYKTCNDCLSLRGQFFDDFYYERLWEHFTNTVHDWDYKVLEDCIAALTGKAREKVCQIIEDGWEWLERR